MFYYEIEFYGEGHPEDWSYYIRSKEEMNEKQIKKKLVDEFLEKDQSLEQHHIDNIVKTREVDWKEFHVATAIAIEEGMNLYKISTKKGKEKNTIEVLAEDEIKAMTFYIEKLKKKKLEEDEKIIIKKKNLYM